MAIDVASGEFFVVEIDHELGGVVPLSFGRKFSTRSLGDPLLENIGVSLTHWEPFGPGWRPTWFAELRRVLDGFNYTRADGTEFSIQDPRGANGFADTGRIRSATDGIELQRVSDTRVRVVGYGRDRHQHSLVFERYTDKQYRLVAIERTSGARVDILYDTAGRPSHLVQQPERRSYELVYEGTRLARINLRLPDQSSRLAVEYGYDARGHLVSVQDTRGVAARYEYDDDNRVVREEKRGGSVYAVRYAPNGRCIYARGTDGYEERSLRYDTHAKQTWVTDSHGGTTLYDWNDRGQVVKTTTPCGVVTRAEFDDRGRPVRQTLPNGELQEQAYDELGHVALERQTAGREQRFRYDEHHRLIGTVDCADDEVIGRLQIGYAEDHNVTSIQFNDDAPWRYVWSPFSQNTTTIAPSGATKSMQYNELGGLVRSTNWEGRSWTWTRDALGRMTSETDPLGNTQHLQYFDDSGRSLRLVDADGRVFAREVSPDGRSIIQHLPGNRSRSVELSFCGQPIELRDEEGAITRVSWGTEPGELLTIANANRADYTFRYDADLRVVEQHTFDGRTLLTEWDGARIAATRDGTGRRTEYAYDARGLLATENNDEGENAYEYDRLGQLARIETPSSVLRLIRDDIGRITAEEQDGIRIDRTLDEQGRLIAQKTPFGGETTFAWSAGGYCADLRYGDTHVSFERDVVGRETKRTLGNAGVFEQSYDSVGRLVSQAFRRTGAGTSAGSVMRQFGFDDRGFIASIQDSLRGQARLMHNGRGDLTGVVRQNGLSDFYDYDSCQNRVYHAVTQQGVALAAALDRETRETTADLPVNRVAMRFPHREAGFGVAAGNRVVNVVRDGGLTELTYDANGQLIAKTVVQGSDRLRWEYRWNARGELVSLTTPNGKVWTYRYDGAGRRIEKRSPTGDRWRYVWMGAVLLHTLKNDSLAETYIHEPGGTCPILRHDDKVHFIIPDQNRAPSEEISENGELEWTARKGTWAEGFNTVGPGGGEPFLGQWFDAESGLHYNLFRYYDPEIGRYISPDPIDLFGGLNSYQSVTDPLRYRDVYGLNECKDADPEGVPENEVLYRTMKKKHYERLIGDEKKMPGTGETMTSPTRWFAEGYDGVLVKFELKPGTIAKLEAIGVRQANQPDPRVQQFPVSASGWNERNALFKEEKGQINIGLGRGPALDTFNDNIVKHDVLREDGPKRTWPRDEE